MNISFESASPAAEDAMNSPADDTTILHAAGGAPGLFLAAAMPAPKCQAPSRSRRIVAATSGNLVPARRSSTRSIKRKKFDDELVESSLVKTERGRLKTSNSTVAAASSSPVSSSQAGQSPGHPALTGVSSGGGNSEVVTSFVEGNKSGAIHYPPVTTPTGQTSTAHPPTDDSKEATKPADPLLVVGSSVEKRSKVSTGKVGHGQKGTGGKVLSSKSVSGVSGVSRAVGPKSGVSKSAGHSRSKSRSKKSKRQKSRAPAVKDLGRWKPQDDIALITAVQQTNDLSAVHAGIKFSCRFSLKEIEERWYALLYDSSVSKIAMEAARQLHPDTVATVQGKALYSTAEEKLLGTITSSSQPTLENFQNLLSQQPEVFHPARTSKTLQCHWLLMKQYHLLPDQSVQPMPRGDHILNLSDIEDFMNDDNMGGETDEVVEHELALVDRRNKREIRHLEQELPKWQVLVDSVTGISMPDFDNQTLAVLRGRLVRYLMRSREISMGRSTRDNHVDVDLSLEGPSWKISRRQGMIKLRNSGDFFIANEGKRPIMVDGRPVLAGSKQKLCHNSVVEIACLRFTFLINQDVISQIRVDSTKTTGNTAPS